MASSSSTVSTFAEALKKSRLLSEEEIQTCLKKFQQTEVELSDPKSLALAFVDAGAITKWQAEKLLSGKHKGFFLGKYKLLNLIGRGGMSAVYLAEHSVMKRRCAIKVLPASRVNDSSYLGRFHLEAQAAASLDDPHIVRAYDVDHYSDGKSDIHFLVMEYVEGKNLHELVMRGGILSPLDAAEYMRQAAMGLEHAHQAGLVHRDIKPGNLLLDLKGTIKILDMGLARFFEESDEESLTIQHDEKVLGTADFLSPEQAINSHNVDSRSDIYSLGCTFYFILTRHVPFEQGSLAQRLMAHQTQEPPPITNYRTDVPESLLQIISKMMAKKPEERYEKSQKVADVLKDWILDHADQDWMDDHKKEWDSGITKSTGSDSNPGVQHPNEFSDFLTMIGQDTDTPPGSSTVTPQSSRISPQKQQPASGSKVGSSIVSQTPGNEIVEADADSAIPSVPEVSDQAQESKPNHIESKPDVSPATSRKRKRSSGSSLQALIESTKSYCNSNPKIVAGIAAGLLVLVIIPFLFTGNNEPPAPTDNTTANAEESEKTGNQPTANADTEMKQPIGIDITVGEKGNFTTLQEAIDYLKEYHDPLTIKDERKIILQPGVQLTTPLELMDPDYTFPKKLRITTATPEQRISWTGNGSGPVLKLKNVEGLILENLQFNAQQATTAIEIQGRCPGVVLRSCRVENFTDAGIDLFGAAGLYNTGIRIEYSKILSTAAAARAIVIRDGEATPEAISLMRLQIIGPLQAGLQCQSNILRGLKIRECIFSKIQQGISFPDQNPTLESITLSNNTFHNCGTAIQLNSLPADNSYDWTFSRNLFLQSQQPDFLLQTNQDLQQFREQTLNKPNGASFNWTSRDQPVEDASIVIFAENARFQATDITFHNSADPAAPNFLKPKGDQVKVPGTDQLKPYVGALSP